MSSTSRRPSLESFPERQGRSWPSANDTRLRSARNLELQACLGYTISSQNCPTRETRGLSPRRERLRSPLGWQRYKKRWRKMKARNCSTGRKDSTTGSWRALTRWFRAACPRGSRQTSTRSRSTWCAAEAMTVMSDTNTEIQQLSLLDNLINLKLILFFPFFSDL